MKTRSSLLMLFVVGVLLLAACGSAMAPSATEAPFVDEMILPAATMVVESYAAQEAPAADVAGLAPVQDAQKSSVDGGAYEIANPEGENVVVQNTNRKVIKNADMRLLVKETSTAINRTTQIVSDVGGYIVSSRVWYQDYFGNNLMYATITMGVPVDEFEHSLNRLRDLSIRVLDENASGEDVTDQYVDLQSQLVNLEATRARIQEFLKDAKSVDEALRINQELANIESQIEQIKGRMNYLSDRAAFSTITVNFEPELPILTPTPTPTIAPTNTPVPTATLAPWKPGETFGDAKKSVTVAYRGIFDFLIWLVVVILPIVLPPALILWGLWKLLNRKPKA
ncbi:MAG: DUF4349 domain-containing protein [Anaerolineales bacterium]|nr:DUF4349 domain-containing protein [Anaerolineales bacterium]